MNKAVAFMGSTHRWRFRLSVKKKVAVAFSVAFAGIYSLFIANALTTQWEGVSTNYILTINIAPSLICGAIIALMYYSYADYHPDAKKTKEINKI